MTIRKSFEMSYFEILSFLTNISEAKYESSSDQIPHDIENHSSENQSAHTSESNVTSIQAEQSNNTSTTASNHTKNQVKLSRLTLPSFSGETDHWLNFRDMFSSLVHNRNDISDVEKFQYLKASLSGEALSLLHSLQLSAPNYSTAWNLLIEIYENKSCIIYNHIKSLFEIELIPKESHVLLQSLLNKTQTNLRA